MTSVKGLKLDGGVATCERAVGSTREVYTVPLPAVITVKDGLNIPRYASVPGRMKARIAGRCQTGHLRRAAHHHQEVHHSEREAKGATSLGSGDEAAAALVDVLKEIGVLA